MHLFHRTPLLWGTAALLASTQLCAQTTSQGKGDVNLALTYTAQRSNVVEGNAFWLQGGSIELAAQARHGLGLAMNVAGTRGAKINGSGSCLNLLTTTFGPRYTLHRRRVSIFGQSLIGEAHGWNSLFPASGGATRNFDTFALQVGGGLDYHTGRHVGVRVVQADWVRTQFPNSTTNVQNNLRLGAGLVVRFR